MKKELEKIEKMIERKEKFIERKIDQETNLTDGKQKYYETQIGETQTIKDYIAATKAKVKALSKNLNTYQYQERLNKIPLPPKHPVRPTPEEIHFSSGQRREQLRARTILAAMIDLPHLY